MAEVKTKRVGRRRKARRPPIKTVEDYLAAVPESAREMFDQLRAAVKSTVPPDSSEAISYGILAFKRDRLLVWIAAFSEHCSLFPTAQVIQAFQSELSDYPTSTGTIRFPLDKPLPVALIKKMVKMRVAQDATRTPKSAKRRG
jgi:uncharacterized protein YdhG (YjbR/CyaY superfamily)